MFQSIIWHVYPYTIAYFNIECKRIATWWVCLYMPSQWFSCQSVFLPNTWKALTECTDTWARSGGPMQIHTFGFMTKTHYINWPIHDIVVKLSRSFLQDQISVWERLVSDMHAVQCDEQLTCVSCGVIGEISWHQAATQQVWNQPWFHGSSPAMQVNAACSTYPWFYGWPRTCCSHYRLIMDKERGQAHHFRIDTSIVLM